MKGERARRQPRPKRADGPCSGRGGERATAAVCENTNAARANIMPPFGFARRRQMKKKKICAVMATWPPRRAARRRYPTATCCRAFVRRARSTHAQQSAPNERHIAPPHATVGTKRRTAFHTHGARQYAAAAETVELRRCGRVAECGRQQYSLSRRVFCHVGTHTHTHAGRIIFVRRDERVENDNNNKKNLIPNILLLNKI